MVVAVMPLALSEAMNAATSATWARCGARRSMAMPAIMRSTVSGSGVPSPPTSSSPSLVRVSTPGGMDAEDAHALRADLGRQVAHQRLGGRVGRSGTAHPGHRPGTEALFRWRMTPDPCRVIRRAAARAVRKFDWSPVTTARRKMAFLFSSSISTSRSSC
jgi:hypothetical protein